MWVKRILLAIPLMLGVLFSQQDSTCFWCLPIDSTWPMSQIEATLEQGMARAGKAPQMTLEGVNILDSLPAIFVTGSITCPRYTGRLGILDSLSDLGVNVITVYTVEAHPIRGPRMPYGCFLWPFSGQVHSQPYTMQERAILRDSMLRAYPHSWPVLMDSPCNDFWFIYGQVPAGWWVIDANGNICEHGLWIGPEIASAYEACAGITGIEEPQSGRKVVRTEKWGPIVVTLYNDGSYKKEVIWK